MQNIPHHSHYYQDDHFCYSHKLTDVTVLSRVPPVYNSSPTHSKPCQNQLQTGSNLAVLCPQTVLRWSLDWLEIGFSQMVKIAMCNKTSKGQSDLVAARDISNFEVSRILEPVGELVQVLLILSIFHCSVCDLSLIHQVVMLKSNFGRASWRTSLNCSDNIVFCTRYFQVILPVLTLGNGSQDENLRPSHS